MQPASSRLRWLAVAAAGAVPMLAAMRLRRYAFETTDSDEKASNSCRRKTWFGAVVYLTSFESCAHVSFFLTGHRGLVQTGTWLKAILDTKDCVSHGLLASTAPYSALAVVHTLLFGWHTAKAADSILIQGYSPMRGLYLPNLIDAGTYTCSALLGAVAQPTYSIAAAMMYCVLRFTDCVY
jgi:hypothetical protein